MASASNIHFLNETVAKTIDNNELIIAKIVAMIVLGLASFLIGTMPIKLTKFIKIRSGDEDNNFLISLFLCFGGGVLLFTTFLHLQPEVRESVELLQEKHKIPVLPNGIPVSELIFCLGFFFVYFIEEIVHMCLNRKHNSNVNLHRTLSVRCGKNELTIPRVTLNKFDDNNVACITSSNKDLLNSQSTLNLSLAKSDSKHSSLHIDHHHHPHMHNGNGVAGHHHHGGGGGHHHHHHIDDEIKNSFRGLIAVLALSFHAIFEGLAVGLENSVTKVWYLFAAIATHKFVIAFCVGIELVSSKTKLSTVILYIGTFAVVTPIGIGAGIVLSGSGNSQEDVTSVFLQGMAAGTLLYVVFFEVLARERSNSHKGVWQLLAIIVGFSVMLSLQIATGHEHSHGHEHGEETTDVLTPTLVHAHNHHHH